MLTLCLLMLPSAGQKALTCLVYIAAIAMMALDVRIAVVIVALLLGGAELSMRLVPGWTDDGSYGFAIFLGALAVFGLRRAIQRSIELERDPEGHGRAGRRRRSGTGSPGTCTTSSATR